MTPPNHALAVISGIEAYFGAGIAAVAKRMRSDVENQHPPLFDHFEGFLSAYAGASVRGAKSRLSSASSGRLRERDASSPSAGRELHLTTLDCWSLARQDPLYHSESVTEARGELGIPPATPRQRSLYANEVVLLDPLVSTAYRPGEWVRSILGVQILIICLGDSYESLPRNNLIFS